VVDTAGNSAEAIMTVNVRDTLPPVLVIEVPERVDMGTEVLLDGSGTWDNVMVEEAVWTFNYDEREETIRDLSGTFTFDAPGTYTLTFKAWDTSGNSNEEIVWLDVVDNEPPMCIVGEDLIIVVETTVTLDASECSDNIGITAYLWAITSEGGSVKERNEALVDYRFGDAGVYNVTLIVTDAWDNEATDSFIVKVKPVQVVWTLGPVVDGKGDPVEGAKVLLTVSGNTYDAMTNERGMAPLEVKWVDLVEPAEVIIKKDGWKKLVFEMDLDEEGNPTGDIPGMKKKKDKTPGAGAALAVLTLLAGLAAIRLYPLRR
jgi:hypothetical protein